MTRNIPRISVKISPLITRNMGLKINNNGTNHISLNSGTSFSVIFTDRYNVSEAMKEENMTKKGISFSGVFKLNIIEIPKMRN